MSVPCVADPAVSVIVPAKDEAEAIPGLLREIADAPLGPPFEVIVVDDGSTDGTADAALATRLPFVRVIRQTVTAGQSWAIRTGALAALAPILVTIDGDGQNDPVHLATLLATLLADPANGLVAAERTGRRDSRAKRAASAVANRIRRAVLADDTRDTGCGLKAMRRSAYLAVPFFDHQHRFLPALFRRAGWRVAHVPVADRPRAAGRSKYGVIDRALVGLPDLAGVWWLTRRGPGGEWPVRRLTGPEDAAQRAARDAAALAACGEKVARRWTSGPG